MRCLIETDLAQHQPECQPWRETKVPQQCFNNRKLHSVVDDEVKNLPDRWRILRTPHRRPARKRVSKRRCAMSWEPLVLNSRQLGCFPNDGFHVFSCGGLCMQARKRSLKRPGVLLITAEGFTPWMPLMFRLGAPAAACCEPSSLPTAVHRGTAVSFVDIDHSASCQQCTCAAAPDAQSQAHSSCIVDIYPRVVSPSTTALARAHACR